MIAKIMIENFEGLPVKLNLAIYNRIKYLFVIFVISFSTLFFATLAFSAPLITSFSGNFSNGNQGVINGNSFQDFGGKIVSWDNFDAQPVGAELAGGKISPIIGPNWTTFKIAPGTDPIKTDNIRAHSGDKSINIKWQNDTINSFGWTGQGPYSQLYISYWRYMKTSSTLDKTMNTKQFFLYGNSKNLPQGMPLIPAGNQSWGYYINNSTAQPNWSGTNNINKTGRSWTNTINRWNRWEYWQKLNTDYNCTVGSNCDGELTYWIDAIKSYERTDYKQRFVNGKYVDFRLGHMAQGLLGKAEAWFDDLYISTTLARVELGDEPNFNTCTHREIQRQQNWATNSITFSINTGSFNAGDTAYIFVIDKNGNTSTGYPVTIGKGVSSNNGVPVSAPVQTIPSSPGNLHILGQ